MFSRSWTRKCHAYNEELTGQTVWTVRLNHPQLNLNPVTVNRLGDLRWSLAERGQRTGAEQARPKLRPLRICGLDFLVFQAQDSARLELDSIGR